MCATILRKVVTDILLGKVIFEQRPKAVEISYVFTWKNISERGNSSEQRPQIQVIAIRCPINSLDVNRSPSKCFPGEVSQVSVEISSQVSLRCPHKSSLMNLHLLLLWSSHPLLLRTQEVCALWGTAGFPVAVPDVPLASHLRSKRVSVLAFALLLCHYRT